MEIKLTPRIRERRMEAHLTQIELAKKIKISKSQLSSIENGRHIPGANILWQIAIGIGCKVDDLYDYEVVY